jgi:hypothetical protein
MPEISHIPRGMTFVRGNLSKINATLSGLSRVAGKYT